LVCSMKSGWTRGFNRNLGARSCATNTTHVAFMDADDEMLPPCLERMVALMDTHRAELGVHSCVTVDDSRPHAAAAAPHMNDSEITMAPGLLAHAWKLDKHLHGGLGDLKRVISGGGHMGHVLARPSLLGRLQYHEAYKKGADGYEQKTANEDSIFVARAVERGARVVHTYEELSVYHLHTSVRQMPVAAASAGANRLGGADNRKVVGPTQAAARATLAKQHAHHGAPNPVMSRIRGHLIPINK